MPHNDSPIGFQSPIQLQLGPYPPVGLDPKIREALNPIYIAVNELLVAFTQYCGIAPQPQTDWPHMTPGLSLFLQNGCRLYPIFSEAVAYGETVNLYNVAGVLTARKANATNNTKPCRAIVSSPGGSSGAGAYAEVMLAGLVGGLTGMTCGTSYFQSTVDGLITNAAPVAAGNIEQYLGFALSTTQLWFLPQYWIQH